MREYMLRLTARNVHGCCTSPRPAATIRPAVLTFFESFAGHDCRAAWLPLFHRVHEDLEPVIREQDLIYVGGGNTANMLASGDFTAWTGC